MIVLAPAGMPTAVDGLFVDLDHEPIAPDGTPEVSAVHVIDGTGVDVDVDATSTVGRYRAVLDPVDALGPVRIEWSGVVAGAAVRFRQLVEIVGGSVASVADVLAHPDMRSLPSVDRGRLVELLGEFVELVTDYRGESPVLRRAVVSVPVGQRVLPWPVVDEVLAVTVDGAPVDPEAVGQVVDGIVDRSGWPAGCARVDLVHGPIPGAAGLRRACAGWVAASLVAEEAGRSRDSLWQTTESGTIRYSSPDKAAGRPTGLIEVDRALNALPDLRMPGIG